MVAPPCTQALLSPPCIQPLCPLFQLSQFQRVALHLVKDLHLAQLQATEDLRAPRRLHQILATVQQALAHTQHLNQNNLRMGARPAHPTAALHPHQAMATAQLVPVTHLAPPQARNHYPRPVREALLALITHPPLPPTALVLRRLHQTPETTPSNPSITHLPNPKAQ